MIGMKKLQSEKRDFNKGYLSVIASFAVLFILFGILTTVVIFDNKEEEDSHNRLIINDKGEVELGTGDLIFDNSVLSCEKATFNKLAEKASKITINIKYEEIQSDEIVIDTANVCPDPCYEIYDGFRLIFENMPNELLVVLTNDEFHINEEIDKEKNYYLTDIVARPVTYTVNVLAKDDCTNNIIRRFSFTTPRYNPWSDIGRCIKSDAEACDVLTYEEFHFVDVITQTKDEQGESNKDDDNKPSSTPATQKKHNYVKYIYLGLFLVAIIAVIILIYFRHRKLVKKI